MLVSDRGFQRLRQSQKRVRSLLKQGKYDDMSLTSYGRLGQFFDFVFRLGFIKIVDNLDIQKRKNGIDNLHLALLWFAKAVLGFEYVDNLKYMFRDKHLMKLCGFSKEDIDDGYSKRTTKNGRKPVHTDSVRNFGSKLTTQLSEQFFTEIVQVIQDKDQITGGTFALDAKYVSVSGKKMGFAEMGYDPHANEYRNGYKLFMLQNVEKGHEYIICASLQPGNQDERAMLLPMVEKATEVLGEDAIDLLLIDRGYLSGPNLHKLKHEYGIDFIIPGMKNMDVVKDAEQLTESDHPRHHFKTVSDKYEVAGCWGMQSYGAYASEKRLRDQGRIHQRGRQRQTTPINVLLVKDNTPQSGDGPRIMSYLTSLPMGREDSAEDLFGLFNRYRQRWAVENNGFKELTSYWNLTKMPGGKFNTICTHLFFTLAAYNLVLLFKTKEAVKMMGHSMATIRRLLFESEPEVVIYAQGCYAMLQLDEIMALGVNPVPP